MILIFGLALLIDLRRRKKGLEALRQELFNIKKQQQTLKLVTESANDGLVLQEMDATILWANSAYCETVGWSLEEIVGRKPQEFVLPKEATPDAAEIAAFRYDLNFLASGVLERRLNVRKNGEAFWHEFNLALVEPRPGDKKVVLVSRDVTKSVEREQELDAIRRDFEHAASHDGLTGLTNRVEFLQRVENHLTSDAPALGLLQLDLDKFKRINDTRGHEAGDQILRHVAQAILGVIRPEDIACRLGGDEFAVGLLGISDFAELTEIAERIASAVAEPIDWRGEQLETRVSIGISECANGNVNPEDLLRRADFALYEAKNKDRAHVACYDAELHVRQEAERALIAEFDTAVGTGGLTFAYQPIVDAATAKCLGFETLARWTTSDGIPVSPPRFLEFAQRLRRKHEIDFAAMRAAIDMAARAAKLGHRLRASFNASTETLLRPEFVAELEWEADRLNLERADVVVEVLETTFFGHDTTDSAAARTISALRKSGFTVMLDDFGVGYAGLSHLDQLDISGLKIDRSLVVSATENRNSNLIVQSLLTLARDLNLIALAEGIETEDQARQFADMGCNLMQGYAFGRPMPEGAFLSFLASQGRSGRNNLRSSVA